MSHLRQRVLKDRREKEVSMLREESDGVRRGGLEGRMVMEVEINSLRAQVNILQKVSIFAT